MTTATAVAPNGKPKRVRKDPGPMTATRALNEIQKLRDKSAVAEANILAQLPESDRIRVCAFIEAQ